jgi:GT2 family glycosyltransferase
MTLATATGVTEDLLLSVVIITRNEEAAIVACLTSVMREIAGMAAEVLLVDSASTDATVQRAADFPTTILRLEDNGMLSAGAGRRVGTEASRGRYILFLDGDMVLVPGWIPAALDALAPDVRGGVCGRLLWVYPGEDVNASHPDALPTGPVEALGGAAMYRREALLRAGTFNPFMRGEEERELGYRLRRHGYTLQRIPTPMAYHLAKERTQDELEEKAVHYTGIGQILRAYPFRSIAWQVLAAQWRALVEPLAACCSLVAVIVSLAAGWYTLLGLLGALLAVTGCVLAAIKGPGRVILYARATGLGFANFVGGLFLGIPPAASYRVTVTSHHRLS